MQLFPMKTGMGAACGAAGFSPAPAPYDWGEAESPSGRAQGRHLLACWPLSANVRVDRGVFRWILWIFEPNTPFGHPLSLLPSLPPPPPPPPLSFPPYLTLSLSSASGAWDLRIASGSNHASDLQPGSLCRTPGVAEYWIELVGPVSVYSDLVL